MVWKTVVNSDSGDADHFGGNDLDKISNLFSGIDVDDVNVNSDWMFTKPTQHENYIDLKAIAEPASPASGYTRVYVDSTTNMLSLKKSNGDVIILE